MGELQGDFRRKEETQIGAFFLLRDEGYIFQREQNRFRAGLLDFRLGDRLVVGHPLAKGGLFFFDHAYVDLGEVPVESLVKKWPLLKMGEGPAKVPPSLELTAWRCR